MSKHGPPGFCGQLMQGPDVVLSRLHDSRRSCADGTQQGVHPSIQKPTNPVQLVIVYMRTW